MELPNHAKLTKHTIRIFSLMHQLGHLPALSQETVQHACMRVASLNEPEGTRHSLHEADKASNSEWPQFLSCKFEAFENTNHDSILTVDRRGALKISKRDLQEPAQVRAGWEQVPVCHDTEGLGAEAEHCARFQVP